jgi:glycerol-3-phosphate dehydrogenase (NAD(P)+)
MITVCGAGAFGTALAVSLAKIAPVTLWARDTGHAAEMA